MQALTAKQTRVSARAVGPSRAKQGSAPRPAVRTLLQRQPLRDEVRCNYKWGHQDPAPNNAARQALVQQMAKANSWHDMRNLVGQYGRYLQPDDFLQLMSAAQGPAARNRARQQPVSYLFPNATPSWHALARAAAGAVSPKQESEGEFRDLMSQLAYGYQRVLPQASGDNVVAMTSALANAGALNQGLAEDLLHHAGKLAAAKQMSMQNLAIVMLTLGKAKFKVSPSLLQQVVWDVDPLNRCESLNDLAGLLEGLSKLGYQPSQSFVDAVMQRMAQRQAATQRQRKQGGSGVLGKLGHALGAAAVGAVALGVANKQQQQQQQQQERERAERAAWFENRSAWPPSEPQQPSAPSSRKQRDEDEPHYGPLFSGMLRDLKDQNAGSKESARLNKQARGEGMWPAADEGSRPGAWPAEPKQKKQRGEPEPQLPAGAWDENSEEAELREQQEAAQIAATVRSLQRMGHTRQAEQLKSTYLAELQARVAARARMRIQAHQQQFAQQQAQLEAQARAEDARLRGLF